ncbi:hypothetical protein CH375_00375 [Leptospira ellisii]|uniref:Uncharacterized protein n=1 Tax=Leptospira ellisii TaxID=2023197 RepID=A0A2N0BQT3_9LEPT|nr:hypothetical protein CH379_06450 [Leptospira ellisii]PKA06326.1 hypothetical protein CH375_00375 [Leptospira ellisii]
MQYAPKIGSSAPNDFGLGRLKDIRNPDFYFGQSKYFSGSLQFRYVLFFLLTSFESQESDSPRWIRRTKEFFIFGIVA